MIKRRLMSFKILFHLLSLTNFNGIILENEKLKIYFNDDVLRISNYWKLVIGSYKFLVKPNDEKFQNLRRAFIELNFELKVKIIDNNWMFGTFLQDNEVFPFINRSSNGNLKYFILTFKKNIVNFNFRKIEIDGSIHEIGRFLLHNKKVKNRKNKIKKIIQNWNVQDFITIEIYLSVYEINELFKKVKMNFFDWIKEKFKQKWLDKYGSIVQLQKHIEESKLDKNIKRDFLIFLDRQTSEYSNYYADKEEKSGYKKAWIKTALNQEKDNLWMKNIKLPWDLVGVLEQIEKPKWEKFLEIFSTKPIVIADYDSKIPQSFHNDFYLNLFLSLVYYKKFMKQNLAKYSKRLWAKNELLAKTNYDFYYFLENKMFFEAGFVAIGFFYRTIKQLFPWKFKDYQDLEEKFWNTCEDIKEFMSENYQYSIELIFLSVWKETAMYLNARNKLMHFKKNFSELDAFAIYTLAVENQRIIGAKIPVEYYQN